MARVVSRKERGLVFEGTGGRPRQKREGGAYMMVGEGGRGGAGKTKTIISPFPPYLPLLCLCFSSSSLSCCWGWLSLTFPLLLSPPFFFLPFPKLVKTFPSPPPPRSLPSLLPPPSSHFFVKKVSIFLPLRGSAEKERGKGTLLCLLFHNRSLASRPDSVHPSLCLPQ